MSLSHQLFEHDPITTPHFPIQNPLLLPKPTPLPPHPIPPPLHSLEQILERRTQQIHDQHVVRLFHTEMPDLRDADSAHQHLVQLVFVQQLRMASVPALHLDGHLFAAYYTDAQVDVAEAARSDLPDDAILAGDDELVGRPNRVEDLVHFAAVRHFDAVCISVCCVESWVRRSRGRSTRATPRNGGSDERYVLVRRERERELMVDET